MSVKYIRCERVIWDLPSWINLISLIDWFYYQWQQERPLYLMQRIDLRETSCFTLLVKSLRKYFMQQWNLSFQTRNDADGPQRQPRRIDASSTSDVGRLSPKILSTRKRFRRRRNSSNSRHSRSQFFRCSWRRFRRSKHRFGNTIFLLFCSLWVSCFFIRTGMKLLTVITKWLLWLIKKICRRRFKEIQFMINMVQFNSWSIFDSCSRYKNKRIINQFFKD